MLKDDINTPLLVTIASISSLLLLVVLMGVSAWYLYEVDVETQAKWGAGKVTNAKVHELQESQKKELAGSPKWMDRDKGLVKIPIAQAMEIVAANGGKLPTK